MRNSYLDQVLLKVLSTISVFKLKQALHPYICRCCVYVHVYNLFLSIDRLIFASSLSYFPSTLIPFSTFFPLTSFDHTTDLHAQMCTEVRPDGPRNSAPGELKASNNVRKEGKVSNFQPIMHGPGTRRA